MITSQTLSVMTFRTSPSIFLVTIHQHHRVCFRHNCEIHAKQFLNTRFTKSRKNTRNVLKIPKKFPDPNKRNLTRTRVPKSLNLGNNSMTWQRCSRQAPQAVTDGKYKISNPAVTEWARWSIYQIKVRNYELYYLQLHSTFAMQHASSFAKIIFSR